MRVVMPLRVLLEQEVLESKGPEDLAVSVVLGQPEQASHLSTHSCDSH